ncbi:MAG: hypothetical protein ACK4NY_20695 [Spirosomataceae bacterium]
MCNVSFFSNHNKGGDGRAFAGPTSYSSLENVYYTGTNNSMNKSIDSAGTDTSAWVVIYDQPNFQGNSYKLYPDRTYDDFNHIQRGSDSSNDWKNQVQSFQLYDHLPASWSLGFNVDTFTSLFPNHVDATPPFGDKAIGYQTQDAEYRIYLPQVSYPDESSMSIYVQIDHIIGMSTDDHVTLNLSIGMDGTVKVTNYTWDAGSAYQIPNSVVKAVDLGAEVAGALGALESAGISEAAAQEFVETFDTCVKVFNDISNLMNKWSENDGGRFYMIPVVCHVINRICYSVTKS